MSDICSEILSGVHDDTLDDIFDAAKQRERLIAQSKVFTFKEGDRVVFNARISPKYLIGAEATVISRNQRTLVVRLDEPRGRFRGQVNAPVEVMDLVS